jgi:recombinational DNA repair protein (RecF pathway)
MEKSQLKTHGTRIKQKEITRCAVCNEPLTTFMAYIPDKGDVCMKCFTKYAQATELIPPK